jgi:hypothetical protein
MIDTMILAGEAGLFVAHHDRWRTRDKVWMWAGTLAALGVSVAANVGHVDSTDWLSHLTAALPPVALAFVTTVGFGVMKRVHLNKPAVPLSLTETPSPPLTEKPLTPFVRTSPERFHVGSQPWVSLPAEKPLTETERPETERPAPVLPESLEPTETFASADFKVIPGKSFTMPPDPRKGLKLPEQRVRDMFDLDPDISVNAVRNAMGIAWQTAKNYLDATKEARGLPA